MEYKVIFTPYKKTTLIQARSGERGTSHSASPAGNFNNELNVLAKKGWKVVNLGTTEAGEKDIVFWALLEKTGA